jgi:hypothetical protein
MIEWKNTRKNGVVAIGTKAIGNSSITWVIKKSAGGLNYQLFLGETEKNPMYSRPSINDCKVLAEAFL